VAKAGKVAQELGEKLKTGAALDLADGGCEFFGGTVAALAKLDVAPIGDAIRDAFGRAAGNADEITRATRAIIPSLLGELKSRIATLVPPVVTWLDSTATTYEACSVFLEVRRREAERRFATTANESIRAIALALTKGVKELSPLTPEVNLSKLVIKRADVPVGVDIPG
jgi:hypothetical protein